MQRDAEGATVSLRIPDSERKGLDVRISDDRIFLSFASRAAPRRYVSERSKDEVIAILPGVDPRSAQVVRNGDMI